MQQSRFIKIIKNKYILATLIFIIWLSFFDRYNWIDRFNNLNSLYRLEKDKNYFMEWNRNDSIRMHELMTNNENLEKFAREQYLMKKENEDIFIIVEEK
ncbi:MAG: FtsB family cell division protein [Bacteroidota bacterium]